MSQQDARVRSRRALAFSLAPIEQAAEAMLDRAPEWARTLSDHLDGEAPPIFAPLAHALFTRALEARTLNQEEVGEAITRVFVSDSVPAAAMSAARAITEGACDAEVLRAPHLLGWFLQGFGAEARDASFQAHTEDEAKHTSATTTTQVYTPRWIADFLAQRTLSSHPSHAERPTISVGDPAVGGGQMLLASLEVLARQYPDANSSTLASCLHGIDLDPRAVFAARASLLMRLQELRPGETQTCAELLARQIVWADGLTTTFATSPDVVLTNPPYMGSRSMPDPLKTRLQTHWRPFHLDLFTAFMRRCFDLAAPDGRVGLLTQQTVWYLSRFEKARAALLKRGHMTDFVHLGPRAFHGLTGEKANVTATVHHLAERVTAHPPDQQETCAFVDVRDLRDYATKREALITAYREREEAHRYSEQALATFKKLPATPIAHWLPTTWRDLFASDGPRVGDIAEVPGSQNKTGANRQYIKDWDEVAHHDLRPAEGLPGDGDDEARWVFYSKGGKFAPWWGNWTHVIDWSEQARDFYDTNPNSNLLAERWRGREGLCYTDFGGRAFNARWFPRGCLFDMAGPAIFLKDGEQMTDAARRTHLMALLAVLNCTPVRSMLNALNPSLHYQVRDVRNIPLPTPWDEDLIEELARCAESLVAMIRALHVLVEGDPLYAPQCATSDGALDRAKELHRACERTWTELDQWVCQLYDSPDELACMPPDGLHDISKRLGLT